MNQDNSRYRNVMDGAAHWGAFYRKHPEQFCRDYLHLRLKLFQKIYILMMFWSTVFCFIASRGGGKTFLSAIYVCARCILYPGTKVCIASGTRGQALAVLEKINYELKPLSPELRAEINEKESRINGTEARIVFYNTSTIKVVTASDSSRGNRCHVLLLDEYRLISKDTIDTVLRKFLTLRRMPRYEELTDEQRAVEYAKEKNITMYLSSAYWKDSWAYTKCADTFKAMLNEDRRQFVCGFPYQLSIKEGLLDPELVQDEMSESDFNEIKWGMEMEALWFGADDGSFFDFDSISKNRKIKYPWLPDMLSSKLQQAKDVRIPIKQSNEIRILSADIALMSSRRNNNDATAIFINQMVPTKAGRYISNIMYSDAYEGMRTDDQALVIRKMFDEFNCDYIVLDCQGVGMGCFDALARDITDPNTGEIYPALSCCNNDEMAARCTVQGADKVIWAIKASAQFNSDAAFLLREGFRSGRVRLLTNEYDGEKYLGEIKGYSSLSQSDKLKLQMPYIHTTLLIDELIKLQSEESGGKIKISERSGMRKDRYSSLSYNYYVATQLEIKMNKKRANSISSDNVFVVKPPKSTGKAVSAFGRNKHGGWY